ncbi:MAG: hypothetical protein IRY90_01650, partial [Actinomadura rubrobrunea]|nr:hypothetical protein [Actinomadura rubrobrunea]
HAHGYSKPLWHDLIWYGFAIVVAGGVLVEVSHLRARRSEEPGVTEGGEDQAMATMRE